MVLSLASPFAWEGSTLASAHWKGDRSPSLCSGDRGESPPGVATARGVCLVTTSFMAFEVPGAMTGIRHFNVLHTCIYTYTYIYIYVYTLHNVFQFLEKKPSKGLFCLTSSFVSPQLVVMAGSRDQLLLALSQVDMRPHMPCQKSPLKYWRTCDSCNCAASEVSDICIIYIYIII